MKKSRLKRVLAGISAAAMAFSLICYAPLNWCAESPYVIKASALAAESDYITDSNGIMSYKFASNNCVDLHGVFDGSWKRVTFSNAGFRSVLRVNGSTCRPNVQDGTETTFGLSVKFEPVFVSDGKLIQLVYNVTNKSEESVDFDFAIGSDVMIGDCDRAPIKKLDKTKDGQETGFLMESNSDYDKNDEGIYAGFGLIMNGAKGANASDFWYGYFNDVDSNMFSAAPENNLSNVDSGATVSWKNRTAAPGETVSLSAYVGIGSAEDLKSLIKEMLSATTDYRNEQLTDLEPNSLYEITIDESDGTQTTHPITSTAEGTIPMTGTDDNGEPYTIIGKSSTLVKKGDGESTEDSDPITIDVADRPDAPDDPNVPKGTVEDIINPSDVETTENSITFPSSPNTEYTIDGGNTWVTPDENGNIVFDNLTEGEEYTIQSRTPATDSSPASPISEGVKIVVQNMVTEDDIDISADDLVFTGEPQSIEVSCDDPDVTITYSTSLDEEFTSEIPVFTDDGVYTVYYCAEKPGCYPKYGSYTVTIVKTFEFDSAEHWKIINGVRTSVGVHTFGDWKTMTEPDCVTDGKKKHICTVCGYYEFESIDAKGHTPAAAVEENRVEPTCTEDGYYDEVVYCSECHYEISRTNRTLDKSGHSFTDYVSDGNADCLTDGTNTAVCDNGCGETDTLPDPGSATGHKWSTKYNYDKTHHWHECENTGCPVTDNSGKDGYAEHISSGAATEDNDEHCTVCGYVIKPALSHLCGRTEMTFVPYAAETCTEDGVKAHYVCRCGKLYADKEAKTEVTAEDVRIPAHHIWSEAWSNDDIHHYHLCTVCGEKNDNALHAYGQWTITIFAAPTADGVKERTCGVCGYVQKGTVKYFPDENDSETGDISNVTDPEENACHGDIDISQYEIIKNFELTDEELCAVENGEDINIFLTVEDITENVSLSDRILTESVLGSGDNVATYLDIKLLKQIGQNAPTQVTDTKGEITIVFEMPGNLINFDSRIERTYYIIRVHDGAAEKINGVFDAVSREFRFSTDKFSCYAIAYKDVVSKNPAPVPEPDPNPDLSPAPHPDLVTPVHAHSHKLKYDETGHWKQCACGDKKDFEEHSYGESEIIREAANGKDGLAKHTCTVCGYSETLPFDDVSAGEGLSAENITLHSDTDDVLLIFISASLALAAAAFVVRRKSRK